jgi:cell division protein FtsN
MLRTSEKETEILLGNKQLLGIFFVVAVLLGVAFYGGYVVGKGAAPKTAPAAVAPAPEQTNAPAGGGTGGETHSVPADSGAATDTSATDSAAVPAEPPPLGSRDRNKRAARPQPEPVAEPAPSAAEPSQAPGAFTPKTGQTFLQVTAVGRDEAEAIADVLQKKGFHAHAVPKPGSAKLYRVIVGPVRDAADLSSTRDSLRKTGFREVIVQRY